MLYVLLVLALLIVVILIAAARKPDRVHYERSLNIAAPPDRILPHLIDFHKWRAWSPYEKKDPEMQRTFSGANEGTGAKYAWNGNKNVGEGSMEIRQASPSLVKIDLRFVRPFNAVCVADFHLVPTNGGTTVTWAMDGPNPFSSKLMSVFMDFDKLIGKDFENGLKDLNSAATR
ncbi:MAG TPA: SRPBCC family protein [Flavobacteriales bacterium]|jgi:hypothetical protein|nr:SRPBCC family protein [Flavobacteriales bacterium]